MRLTVNKLLIVAVLLAGALVSRGGAAEVTSEDVRQAVNRAVAYLKQAQGANGTWRDNRHQGGVTALCVLGLVNAGVPADDPLVLRGLQALRKVRNSKTYVVSLKAQAFAADPEKYARELQAAANWLCLAQQRNGMWSYTTSGTPDNSNTQFALLGLHEAAKAGANVPKQVWERAKSHFENTQSGDGGWGYRGRSRGYGSMTTAGVASLYICGQRLHVGGRKIFINGAYPDCGKYKQNEALAGGLNWLAKNFSVSRNPGGASTWLYYYLYGLERVGMISGLRNLGRHDWYREGATRLVATQRGGQWGQLYDTAFALLFLAKGNRPVLFQKLKWNGRWNRNIHDLENLTAFIDDKFGKKVTWQTASLELSLQELRVSPIMFITGHEFPRFADAQKELLRRYVDSGGTLLAEACCGAKEFDKGFRLFAKDLFREYRLKVLPEHHPVFKCYFRMKERYGLEGIDIGCRTGVFYSPNALSCLWELQTIEKYSDLAFRLGTNIAAYATGKQQLQDKLDEVELPVFDKAAQPFEVPRGAVRIARLIHDGDYNSDPHAMVNLAPMLRDKAKVDVVARQRHLRATDQKLFEYPVVFMTGHFSFELPDKEIAALRLYLERGGVLIADACCGRKAFDKSFRAMVAALFPKKKLTALADDHPIYTGTVGQKLGELRYRRILADELKSRGTTRPPLEVITIKDRTAIIYSKYDWSCALEGDRPYSCRGYCDKDGKNLAMNIFLYAISY
ncbi:MAG: DUF4159 domain-containing protein [Phycisphaerae bacterium]|nr:DUF4159 domain-containing protein [Phycisphaerae bacterium]